MLRVADGVRDGVRLAIPQPTEWQRGGNQPDATFISTRTDLHAGAEVIRNVSEMTYVWSGFRIACLGEKSPAQSVEQPDSHNAAVLYNDTEIFSAFCYATREKRNFKRKEC